MTSSCDLEAGTDFAADADACVVELETTSPFASVTVVVVEPFALVVTVVVSALEEELDELPDAVPEELVADDLDCSRSTAVLPPLIAPMLMPSSIA